MARVTVRTELRPTEDLERVKGALLSLFPDLAVRREGDRVVGEGHDLTRFREAVRNQKIRDTARGVLLAGLQGSVTTFALNKQVAAVGKVSFSAGSPLGDLEVTIEDEAIGPLVDWLTESTKGRVFPRP